MKTTVTKNNIFTLLVLGILFSSVSLCNAQNILYDGDFSTTTTIPTYIDGPAPNNEWYTWQDVQIKNEVTVVGGVCKYDVAILNAQKIPDDMQLIQAGFPLIQQHSYRLSFDIKADANRTFGLFLGENGGNWTNLLGNDRYVQNATTEWKTITIDFITSTVFVSHKVSFELGAEPVVTYFDNVMLVDLGMATPSIGILGTALNGWIDDIDLQTTNDITYTLENYTFTDGYVKFRQDNGWIVNWGDNTFPSGTGIQDGPDIPVTAGIWNVAFNRLTGEYSFTPGIYIDDQAPVLACPDNQTLNVMANTCAANYTIADPISDNSTSSTWGYTLSGATTAMVWGIADGTGSGILSFKKGVTTVALNGTDGTNNALPCSFTVTVLDDQKPTITAPETVIVAADAGKCTASGVALGTPTIGDNCMIDNVTSDAVEPFALGNTTVTWTVTDGSGNTATATQTVTINPNITIGTVSGTTPLCIGATATYTSNGDAGGTWSSSNTSVATVNESGLVTTWSVGTTEITYTLSGCTEPLSEYKTLTVDPAIGATMFTTGATTLCQDAANETYTAIAEGSSAIAYSVLPISAGVIDTNSGIMNWDPAFNGMATITATATGLCGTTSADREVVVNPLPIANAGLPSTIIPGNSATIGTIAEEGMTYSWFSNPAGFTSAVANPTVSPIVTTTYTLTVLKTASGCTNSDSVTITVANLLPMANAGADTTVYYGYPPSQCATLYGSASGGTPPYLYSWSNGVVTESTLVCPMTTTIYTLTVTDAYGYSVSDDVTVNVIDVSCGNNKVKVCHENKTVCIAIPAVKAHLAHGDSLGDCTNNSSIAAKTANTNSMVLYPNPTAGSFTVEVYKANVVESALLQVVDFNGHLIYAKAPFKIDGYFKGTIDLNQAALPDGIYFLQLIIGEKTETQKIILKK